MPERKYMSHSSQECTGTCINRNIKVGLGGSTGSRAETVKQYHKSENKWKKELKAPKKQNKMLFSIANKFGLRCEIKKTEKIRAATKRRCESRSDSSREELNYNS